MPVLLEHLSKKSDNTFLTGILSKTKSISVVAVKGALRALPQETRDELAVVCINYYKEDIIRVLTETVQQRDFPWNWTISPSLYRNPHLQILNKRVQWENEMKNKKYFH